MNNYRRFPKKKFTLLEFYRRKRDWSGEHLAQVTGIPQTAISSFELGRRVPKPEELKRLAFALGISPPEVLLQEATIKPEDVVSWPA